MAKELKKQMILGFKWMSFSTIIKIILQFIFIAILARLIGPEAYGIQAISMLVISSFQAISDGGIGKAIIQSQNIKNYHLSTLFYFSLFFSIIICFFVNYISFFVSIFFNVVELEQVIPILSFVFVLRGLSVVAESIAIKEMNFKPLAIRNLLSYVIANLLVGIPLAFYGFGIWSLVLIVLTHEALRTLFILSMVSHPKSIFDFQINGLKEVFKFGSGITLASIFNKIAVNGDTLIIGKFVGVYVVGLYSRAYKFVGMPANLFSNVISTTIFPALSSIQKEDERIQAIHFKLVSIISTIFLPISIFISIRSDLIVKIIFGNNWIDVTPILQILALGLYFRIGYKINSEIVKAKGMVFNNAFIQLIYAILVVTGCYVGQFYGINGISFGILSALIINFINMTYIGIKASKIKPSRIFHAHFNGILISFTIYFVLSLIDNFTFYINSSILFKALSSFIIYLLINLVFVELTGRDKVIKLLLNIVGKKNVKKK